MSFDYDGEMERRGSYQPGVTGTADGGRAMIGRQSPAAVAGVMSGTDDIGRPITAEQYRAASMMTREQAEEEFRRAMQQSNDHLLDQAVESTLARAGRNADGSLTSGVDVVDPETGGAKGMKAERYGLIPTWPIAELARVYGYGAKKYSDNNWRRGYRWGLSYDALQRHINAFWAGEPNDPESTFHHLAHAMFHLATLMTYDKEGLGTDDRADNHS